MPHEHGRILIAKATATIRRGPRPRKAIHQSMFFDFERIPIDLMISFDRDAL